MNDILRHLAKHEVKLEYWHKFLNDKSVAVVGGDDDIDWGWVNKCNYVARVNGHWQRQRGRCDILYYSCADDLDLTMFDDGELYKDLQFAWVNAAHTLFNSAEQLTRFLLVTEKLKEQNIPMFMYVLAPARAFEVFERLKELPEKYAWTRELAEKGSFHPLTGIAATYHLNETEAHTVYVDGMNFYQKPNREIPETHGVHDMASQMKFLKNMWIESEKIILSPKLVEILSQELG